MKDGAEIDGSAATGKLLVTTDATVDKITGGSAADKFTITVGDLGSSNAAKTIDGGAGEDTLVIGADLSAADFDALSGGKHTVKAEIVQADFAITAEAADATRAVDVAGVTGAVTVKSTMSNDDVTGDHDAILAVTGISTGGTVDVSASLGANAANGSGNNVTIALENASGTADAVTFDGDGVVEELTMVNTSDDSTTVGVTETGDIEQLVISSSDVDATTGKALTLAVGKLTGDDLTKVSITGSNNVTVSAFDLVQASGNNSAGVAAADRAKVAVEIDATGSTGNVTLTSAETGYLNIKGGSGKLDVDLGGTATKEDTITGGAGTTDTLTVHDSSGAATFDPTTTGVEILQIETITSGAKTTSLKNTTGVETVQIIDEVTGAGFGTTVSNINGQTIELVTHSAATTTDFSSAAMVLTGATGVTNVAVKFGSETNTSGTVTTNDGAALDGVVLSTNAGKFTITDAVADYNATSGADDAENHAYEVAGTASTALLTSLVISGGGDTDTTSAAMNANTHTVTASTNTAITSIDATGMVANLNMVNVAVQSGSTVNLGAASTTTTVAGADLVADEVKFVDAGGDDIIATTGLSTSALSSIRLNSTGIETAHFEIGEADAVTSVATTLDFRDAVGLMTAEISIQADASGTDAGDLDENLTISNLADGAKVILTGDDADSTLFGTSSDTTTIDAAISGASTVTVSNKNAGATVTVLDLDFGTTYTTVTIEQEADQDFDFTDIAGSKVATLNLGAANSVSGTAIADADFAIATASFAALTTMNIDSNAGDVVFGSTALSAAKLATLNVVGDKSVGFGASSGSTTTVLADVNGSTATGAITFGTSVDFAAAADIATGTGNDTLNLVVTTNTSTSLAMGEKASDNDTVNITGTNGLGLTVIDLSAADQISQLNGVVNSAAQTGIESIDLSGLTGSYGAQITGSADANTITGTANADVITGGEGIDTITGGAGDDTITITETTAAVDTVALTTASGLDTITGFTAGSGGDVLQLSVAGLGALHDGNSAAVTAGTTVVIEQITADETVVAGENIFNIAGNIADAAALKVAMETGAAEITQGTAATAGDDIIVLFDNGVDSFVASVNIATIATKTIATVDVDIVATLVGVSDSSTLDASNFAFIA